MKYQLTARAKRQLAFIWSYIAEDSEQHADRLLARLRMQFQMLGENPRAGRRRDDIRPDLRSFPMGEYLIFYRITSQGVRITDVVHGRRDLRKLSSN